MNSHWIFKILVFGVALTLILWILLEFALSDFMGTAGENIWQTKPWRPVARAAFGFVMITLVVVTTGVVLQLRKR